MILTTLIMIVIWIDMVLLATLVMLIVLMGFPIRKVMPLAMMIIMGATSIVAILIILITITGRAAETCNIDSHVRVKGTCNHDNVEGNYHDSRCNGITVVIVALLVVMHIMITRAIVTM